MDARGEERNFKIRRNLSDAGCDPALIEQFLALEQKKRRREQYQLLARHKAVLLAALHREQGRIDSLDHMVYAMQSEDRRENGGV